MPLKDANVGPSMSREQVLTQSVYCLFLLGLVLLFFEVLSRKEAASSWRGSD